MSLRWDFVQVAEETWDNAPRLARLFKVTEEKAFKILCDAYRWGRSLGADPNAPDGICVSPRAARILAVSVGVDTDRAAELVDALVDLGIIEQMPEHALRIKGVVDRYGSSAEKASKRSENARKAANARWGNAPSMRAASASHAEPMLGDANTETETKTETKKSSSTKTTESTAPPPIDGRPFFAFFQEQRVANGLAAEEDYPDDGDAWFAAAVAKAGGDQPLRESVRGFGSDPYWAKRGYPFAGFMAQFERHLRFGPKSAPKRECLLCDKRGNCGSERVPLCWAHMDECGEWCKAEGIDQLEFAEQLDRWAEKHAPRRAS